MFKAIFEEISTKSTKLNIKLLLNIKYDFKLYRVCIYKSNTKKDTVLYLVEKSTYFLDYTDIEIYLNSFTRLSKVKYIYAIDYAIRHYLQITKMSEISIKSDNEWIQKVLLKNQFILNQDSIYKNMYNYKYIKKKDMVI